MLELYEWSLGQHLARGRSSMSSPTGAGTEASSAATAQAAKDGQERRGQGGINAGRKRRSWTSIVVAGSNKNNETLA